MVMVVASGSVIDRHAVPDSTCRSGAPLIYDESDVAGMGGVHEKAPDDCSTGALAWCGAVSNKG